MKTKIVRESDFNEIEIEVDDKLVEVATMIDNSCENPVGFFYSEDGKKVVVYHRTQQRCPGEKDTHMYKITIEKIPYE